MENRIDSKLFLIYMFVLFSQLLFSKNTNFVFICIVFVYLLFKSRFRYKVDFPGIVIYIFLLLMGLVVGNINISTSGHSSYSLFKHVYYFMNTIIYWSIGSMLGRKNIGNKRFYRTIYSVFSICTIYDVISSIVIMLTSSYSGIHELRSLIGAGNIYPILVIYLLLFSEEVCVSNFNKKIMLLFSSISILIHFSRISILELFVLILCSGALKKIKLSFKIILISVMGIIVLYCLAPTLFSSFIDKIMSSSTELKINGVDWNYVSINHNWRGYELYCELKHFGKAGVWEQLFGGGFGATLDVFGYANLVTDENSLIFLHNGYGTILMIWGILGILLYGIWIIVLYKKSNNVMNVKLSNFLKGLVIIITIVTNFIMGPFFSESVAIYIMIFATFYSYSKKKDVYNLFVQ